MHRENAALKRIADGRHKAGKSKGADNNSSARGGWDKQVKSAANADDENDGAMPAVKRQRLSADTKMALGLIC